MEVYRNVIKNMARSIEAVIKAKMGTTVHCKKTVSSRVPHCKIDIKPIAGTKLLYFGMTKDKISPCVL